MCKTIVSTSSVQKLRRSGLFLGGRVGKNCSQIWVLLLKNNITYVEVKSSHPNDYLSKSKKVFGEKTIQVLSNFE